MRGGGLHPNRPKTFARNPTLRQEVANISIYDKGSFPSGNWSFWSLQRARPASSLRTFTRQKADPRSADNHCSEYSHPKKGGRKCCTLMVLHQCGDKKDLWDAVARVRARETEHFSLIRSARKSARLDPDTHRVCPHPSVYPNG